MQIYPRQLNFNWTDQRKQMKLINNSSSEACVFKIKTTDLKLLSATPCKGFLEPRQTKIIEVKCNETKNKFEAKLQIMSAHINQKLQSFDATWNKTDKSKFSTDLIVLNRIQSLEPIKEEIYETPKLEEADVHSSKSLTSNSSVGSYRINIGMEMTQYSSQMQLNMRQTRKNSNMIHSVTSPLQSSKLSQVSRYSQGDEKTTNKMLQTHIFDNEIYNEPKMINGTRYTGNKASTQSNINYMDASHSIHPSQRYTNSSQHTFTQLTTNQLAKICHLQGQLLSQKQQNDRLRKQMLKNKQFRKNRFQYERQLEINRSMYSIHQQQQKINWSVIGIVAIVFFTIGVLLSTFG